MEDSEDPQTTEEIYLSGGAVLSIDFTYPDGYLEYIKYMRESISLGRYVLPLGFFGKKDVEMFACTVKDASDRKLIPFLTEDDALYCFDAAGPIIYIIDLAEEDGKAKPTKYENFLDLVNDIREDYGLPPWLPSEK